MKKRLMKIFATTLAITSLSMTAVSCTHSSTKEKIDETKTQLYVFNFSGGYGTEWVANAKAKFEELNKDVSWQEGKTGVQIIIDNQKVTPNGQKDSMLDGENEVFFSEGLPYYEFKNAGLLGDITDAVTTKLTKYNDDKTIEDKMATTQKDYLSITEASGERYYAVPHYESLTGFNYDIELFEEKGYYFAEMVDEQDPSLGKYFINKEDTREGRRTKSAGLDGIKGTFDDGLPRTYDDFYKLCDYISLDCVPLTWGGTCYPSYFNRLLESLAADYEGLEQASLNYTLNGTAKTLIRLNGNGEVMADATQTTITENNFGELSRQAGKYYALKFVEKIVTTESWQHSKAFNSGYEHLDAQDSLLRGRFSDDAALPTVAMLMDGVWWEMEAEDTFKYMEAEIGESASRNSRRFGIMPFPKATEEKAEQAKQSGVVQTYVDSNKSFAYMKSNVAEDKKALAKEFIMFCCSDEMLRDFTLTTNTFKALDYNMSDTNGLSAYGKSLAQLREKSEVLYPLGSSAKFINNEAYFDIMSRWSSKFNDLNYNSAASAMYNSGLTASAFFEGLKSYADNAIRGLK